MIAHIVMWRIVATADKSKAENVQLVRQKLSALPEIVPGIREYEIGLNESDSGAAYDVVLISRFASWDDLRRYRQHPDHKRVAEFIAAVRSESAVADYEY